LTISHTTFISTIQEWENQKLILHVYASSNIVFPEVKIAIK